VNKLLVNARRSGQIQSDVSLAWNKLGNVYHVSCDSGRPVRPVYREGVSREQVIAATSWTELTKLMDFVDARESDVSRFSLIPFHPTLRSEIHMSFCMSPIANLVPFLDHNPATRNDFAIAQQKQACSWYHTNYNKRFDTISSITTNPQKPLCHTWFYREMMGSGGCMPYGENAIVAFTMYGGHNQEDSVILNHNSLKRGMFRTAYFHSYDIQEEMIDPASMTQTLFANPLTNAKYEAVKRKEDTNYEMLDSDGIIKLDSIVNDKTVLVGMVSPIKDTEGNEKGYRDVSELPKRGQHGRVDAIYHYAMAGGIRGVKIRIVEERSPQPGDKMASRHSQKGTVGQLLSESDMPFTANGVRPDMIFNPHGIPTRMTVGQFLETTSSKVGLQLGSFVDATSFSVSNRIADLKTEMIMRGFEPYGHETLYNGMTGEMMEADIFMGPIYYQRLKHMVEDKINYRSTGPKTLLTHQPLHGRSRGGGLAVGEMERDGMIAHGMSKFLHESFMDRSDKTDIQINGEGRLDTSKNTIAMPYASSLFVKELESCHIEVKMEVQ
jgi:DNA-directed RNA polymerase beta subunit